MRKLRSQYADVSTGSTSTDMSILDSYWFSTEFSLLALSEVGGKVNMEEKHRSERVITRDLLYSGVSNDRRSESFAQRSTVGDVKLNDSKYVDTATWSKLEKVIKTTQSNSEIRLRDLAREERSQQFARREQELLSPTMYTENRSDVLDLSSRANEEQEEEENDHRISYSHRKEKNAARTEGEDLGTVGEAADVTKNSSCYNQEEGDDYRPVFLLPVPVQEDEKLSNSIDETKEVGRGYGDDEERAEEVPSMEGKSADELEGVQEGQRKDEGCEPAVLKDSPPLPPIVVKDVEQQGESSMDVQPRIK
eukprot:749853-Hanusia_phi.AAC.7